MRTMHALIVKYFQALTCIPPNHVTKPFQELIGSLDAETDELLSDFVSYFEVTWVGVVQRSLDILLLFYAISP